MKFFKVPVVNGVVDIDYKYLSEGVIIDNCTAYVALHDNAQIRKSWKEVTEEEFRQYLPEHDLEDEKQESAVSEQEIINSELLLAQALILLELMGGDK